ncbi:hypothetical protein HPB47_003838 [Ixodes persulcatus]|uniref:Uncharacterized protein n=1 Tax=Ixodes persulcatus TaxID=34615 RepID=A0AC60PHC6_IXOPE|nr:hypothetical protein HPB47_003838 [Ixodes persulcatus]
MVFHKVWCCKSHKRKVSDRCNAACMARLDVKIMKLTKNTRKNDTYLRRHVPLVVVIRSDPRHTHSTQSADALRGTSTTKKAFLRYFSDGMTVSEARRLHESKLCLEDCGSVLLANGALNATARTAQHWHSVWRSMSFGGGANDLLSKLEEKASLYAARVLVVTPIMQWAQTLDLAKDTVFIDSTSSCNTTKCTVKAFVARVEAFLGKREEWVLLFRANITTWGHNTNNFAKATIRVLKDMVLNRTEAFSAVALVDAVAAILRKPHPP